MFTEPLPSNDRGYAEMSTDSPFIGHGPQEKITRPTILLLLRVLVTRKRVNKHIPEPLPSNGKRGYTCRHTDRWEGFMKHAIEMDPLWHFVKAYFLRWGLLAQHTSWRATPCRLSVTAHSIYSQGHSICGGRLLDPQPEDAPCRGEKGHT
jgi:hypothetical protein